MKTVLVTGAAGAVGSALVPVLLKSPDVRLVLLLRSAPGRTVSQRGEELKRFWSAYGCGTAEFDRIEVVEGDVGQERLGLSEAAYGELRRRVTHIAHGAAQVKLNMSEEEARRSSLGTTMPVLRLAQEAPNLEKLDYLSTVGVAGTTEGGILERRLDPPPGFHNTYESSKAEAENAVWAARDQGLPITVHRPSMVVGDSHTGRTLTFQVFYHLVEFLTGRVSAGWVPRLPRFRLDIVPNDFVAQAVAASLNRPEWAGRVLHLSSGRDGSLLLDRYVELVPPLLTAGGVVTPPPRRFPWTVFRFAVPLLAAVAPPHRRKAFRHLPRFLSYLKEETFFDNQNTLALLKTAGIPLPRVQDFLPALIAYYSAAQKQHIT
ncbi:MAG: SDR family oxidoreductase [Elusimicrobia bacterium]|nr:SDR family oxidoreductase [Elusimicrobiota bacterium]